MGGRRIGLVGIGKIARDQHVPAIRTSTEFVLAATADPAARLPGVDGFDDLAAMLDAGVGLDAVAICTPPRFRKQLVLAAVEAGLHVLIEKPPAVHPGDVAVMAAAARDRGCTLFTAWHSREAGCVAATRAWLADRRIERINISWKEDIRRWHPGQDWILDESGFGVFDPGINALSILTALIAAPVTLEAAALAIPEGRGAPVAATLSLRAGDAPVHASFDFLQHGDQTWEIAIVTDAGRCRLQHGGHTLSIDGMAPKIGEDDEYPRLYRRFAALIAHGSSHVDDVPLRLVRSALDTGARTTIARFDW